jgi:hypothetical protein
LESRGGSPLSSAHEEAHLQPKSIPDEPMNKTIMFDSDSSVRAVLSTVCEIEDEAAGHWCRVLAPVSLLRQYSEEVGSVAESVIMLNYLLFHCFDRIMKRPLLLPRQGS